MTVLNFIIVTIVVLIVFGAGYSIGHTAGVMQDVSDGYIPTSEDWLELNKFEYKYSVDKYYESEREKRYEEERRNGVTCDLDPRKHIIKCDSTEEEDDDDGEE